MPVKLCSYCCSRVLVTRVREFPVLAPCACQLLRLQGSIHVDISLRTGCIRMCCLQALPLLVITRFARCTSLHKRFQRPQCSACDSAATGHGAFHAHLVARGTHAWKCMAALTVHSLHVMRPITDLHRYLVSTSCVLCNVCVLACVCV